MTDCIEQNKILENDDYVLICTERLMKLELLEKQMPDMIELAILEYKKNKLKMLHEKDKSNPGAVNIRVKRYNEKHKEEINAKRRAKRKLQKELNEANKPHINTLIDSFNTNKTFLNSKIVNLVLTDKKTHIVLETENAPPKPCLEDVLTVRFDS